jgi:site-specific recombinase XerC
MGARSHQLYSLTSKRYLAPNYVDLDGKLHTRPANDVPIMQWPDGSWCHPANRFMWELFEKGLSRRNRGGSLSVAAAHLSQLLRYCWKQRIDPIELNDNHFREFISGLIRQKRPGHPEQQARTANAVIAIGRSCIAFLDSVGQYDNDEGFIGPKGRIQATKREHIIVVEGRKKGGKKIVLYWDHPALPEPSTKKKRLPIATASIEKLRKAIARISRTPHQRIRRYVMLKLLEVTTARRGEIALITVESVLSATRMEMPMLRVPTLKKRGGRIEYRYIPISRADAKFLAQYAEIHRRAIVKRKLKGQDHGLLLLNGRTGEALQPNTITQEIRRIAEAAGMQEKACPHMFRHRFITKLFVALIEQHQIENSDHFRRMLIDGEEFKRKVAEWTGHSALASLDVYINLAFDEIGNFRKVYNLTTVNLALDSFIGTLHAEVAQVEAGEIPLLSAQRLLDLANSLRLDLDAAKTAALADSTSSGARSAVST